MEIMASSEEASWPGDGFISSAILFATAQEEEQRGEDQVDGDDHEDRGYDSGGCGTADLLRAAAGAEALVAADRGDGGAEHDAFDQAGDDIAEEERVHGRANVAGEREVRL